MIFSVKKNLKKINEKIYSKILKNLEPMLCQKNLFLPGLPKTRIEKIMRRLLKLIIENKNRKVKLRDLSTFTNKNSLSLIIKIIKKIK